jgi:hypothetical protein
MDGLISDPWISAQIDDAVAPYVGRLPAEEIAWMRARLLEALATEPQGRDLVQRARPRLVERSGEVARDAETSSDTKAPRGRRNRAG